MSQPLVQPARLHARRAFGQVRPRLFGATPVEHIAGRGQATSHSQSTERCVWAVRE
jgi:hypothetical protein